MNTENQTTLDLMTELHPRRDFKSRMFIMIYREVPLIQTWQFASSSTLQICTPGFSRITTCSAQNRS